MMGLQKQARMIATLAYEQKWEEGNQLVTPLVDDLVKLVEDTGDSSVLMILKKMLPCIEEGDYITLADILAFELIPVLQEKGNVK